MANSRILFITALVLFNASVPDISAGETIDVVYLKDGSVIRGVIVEQIPNLSLKIQTRDGLMWDEGSPGAGWMEAQRQKGSGTDG